MTQPSYVSTSDPSEIDAIALAAGPGLPPCLAVGRDAAVSLSRRLEVPIFAVNHLEAHILVASLAVRGGSPIGAPGRR